MKKLIAGVIGMPSQLVDMSPSELAQRQQDEARAQADMLKPQPPTMDEKVEALLQKEEGNPTLLEDIKRRRKP